MMRIGKYLIQVNNDNRHNIQWHDDSGQKQIVNVPDLEDYIKLLVERKLENRTELINLFRMAIEKPSEFCNLLFAQQMLQLMPDKEKMLFHEMLQCFIDAYAELTGVQFNIHDLQIHLLDIKNNYF
jgi:hypothetical protein